MSEYLVNLCFSSVIVRTVRVMITNFIPFWGSEFYWIFGFEPYYTYLLEPTGFWRFYCRWWSRRDSNLQFRRQLRRMLILLVSSYYVSKINIKYSHGNCSLVQRSPTDSGGSLCVIKKTRR